MNEEIVCVDFNFLSEHGLLYKINKEVLHPLGLALTRDTTTGHSEGCIIADDFIWYYDEDAINRNEPKLNNFLDKRIEILEKVSS